MLAPFDSQVITLKDVPDPVFAAGMVGAGVGLLPHDDVDVVSVAAPVGGRLLKIHPHAFIIQASQGPVLVHLGVDTVGLEGAGFTVRGVQGQDVSPGQILVEWDLRVARAAGLMTATPVLGIEVPASRIRVGLNAGDYVKMGTELFTLAAQE